MVKAYYQSDQLEVVFQYSLCRVVLMVVLADLDCNVLTALSVLALSSRFDGPGAMPCAGKSSMLSVLALSSRFDGLATIPSEIAWSYTFSTRSVESF